MSREVLEAVDSHGANQRFLLEVFEEDDHWTSTLTKLDQSGRPLATKVAPRFYGVSYDQARRRMLDVLENQFDEVYPALKI